MFYSNLKKAFEGKIVWKSNSCGMEVLFSHVLPQWFPNLAWSAYKLKNQKISPNAWVTSEFQDCAFFLLFASSNTISVLRAEFCSQWNACIIYFLFIFSRILRAAIFMHTELTGKAFTDLNRERTCANTKSLLFTKQLVKQGKTEHKKVNKRIQELG